MRAENTPRQPAAGRHAASRVHRTPNRRRRAPSKEEATADMRWPETFIHTLCAFCLHILCVSVIFIVSKHPASAQRTGGHHERQAHLLSPDRQVATDNRHRPV